MIRVFIQVLLPVSLILGSGWLIGYFFDLNKKTLSTLSLYLFTPLLVFDSISKYPHLFQWITLRILATVTLTILIIWLLVEILARLLKWQKSLKTIILLILILSNTGNWGLPINEAAYGQIGLETAVIILVIMAVYSNTLGVYLSSSDQQTLSKSLKTIFKLPLFYALLLALIVNFFHLSLPHLIFKPLHTLASVAVPFNLLLLGIHLSSIRFKENLPLIFGLTIIKLLVIPIFAFGVAKIFLLEGINLKVTITQLSMPTAVYTSILSHHFEHHNRDLSGQVILVSTLFSVFSLSFLIHLFSVL